MQDPQPMPRSHPHRTSKRCSHNPIIANELNEIDAEVCLAVLTILPQLAVRLATTSVACFSVREIDEREVCSRRSSKYSRQKHLAMHDVSFKLPSHWEHADAY
jgi:hypothetical protein